MSDDISLIVNGIEYTDKQVYLKMVQRLNEVPTLDVDFVDVLATDSNLRTYSWVALKATQSAVYVSPKFMINEPKEKSVYEFGISCQGWVERRLADYLVVKTASANVNSQAGRPQYDDKQIDDIVDEQLAEYSTGVSAGTVSSEKINIRSEGDKLISFFYGLANVSGTDFYASYSSDMATSSINIGDKGSDKSATISLNISGANQNCEYSEKKVRFDLLKNSIKCYGYGDGINQLESKLYHATSVRTRLASNVTDSQNTLPLVDASGFGASGSVWVGCEKCSYTGKSTNTLTGVTRGVAFEGNVKKAYAHSVNSPVYDAQYTESSPQSSGAGSSINTHGIKMDSFEAREIIDQSTLDIITEKILLERKGKQSNSYSPPESILVYPEDYVWALENISVGDEISINDSEAGLSGKYRVYGMNFLNDYGNVSLEFEVSNATQNVLKEIKEDADKGIVLSKYMQGATNIFSINETDNVESGTDDYLGLTMFFNIPEDAVAINSVKLSYRNEAPKTWSSNTSSGGGSTSGSGGGSTVTSGSGGGTTATSGSNSESTMQSGSSSFLSSISTNTTSWQDVTTLTATTSAYSIVSCACSIQLASTNSEYDSNPMNSDYIAYRLYDGSSYYPNSNGIRIPLNFGWSHHHYDSGSSGGYVHGTPLTTGTSFFANGAGAIIYPKNTSGKTVKLQVALNRSISSSYAYINYAYQVLSNHTHDVTLSNHTHSVTVANHTHSTPNHTHTIAYDLAQQTYTTTDIRIWTTDDASGTPTWTERTSDIETVLGRALSSGNNQSEIDLSLTSYFGSTGWKGIKITTNGNSRIKGQVIVKCYIQSRLVD